jgi:hypothetical protein
MLDHVQIKRRAGSVAPPPRVALAVRALLEAEGEVEAAARLGISRATLVRIAGRMTCRRGSILAAATALGLEVG